MARLLPRIGAALAILIPFGLISGYAGAPRSESYAGTVTFALPVGSHPDYISPFVGAAANNVNLFQLEPLLYRPLYWMGNHGQFTVNYGLSIGQRPIVSNGGRTLTIRMNHYEWSDGHPVTNRDVELWMDIYRANKVNYVGYVPGNLPDDLSSMSFPSQTPYEFSLTFKKPYSLTWLLYQELSQIFPIPQHAWDRTSPGGSVGNYDRTISGAQAVYKFINAQAGDLATYTTNPLWKVVDGPWLLRSYTPATGYSVFVPNRHYTGPDRPHIARYIEEPFTSDAAEFNSLRAGELDYGYLPSEDIPQLSYFRARGYQIKPWADWGLNGYYLDYGNHTAGPIFRQLYFRQALAYLTDQKSIIRHIYHGFAFPTYGIVPVVPKSSYLTTFQSHNPYPYSVRRATELLASHGWSVKPNGVDLCVRPGAGPADCGPGVKKMAQLSFSMQYSSGSTSFSAELEAFKSAYSLAGIQISLSSLPAGELISKTFAACADTKAGCSGQMIDIGIQGTTPTYSPQYLPLGVPFIVPGPTFPTGLVNPTIAAYLNVLSLHYSPATFSAFENYVAKELPMIWQPGYYYQISVVAPRMHGWLPQDPNLNIYPQNWTAG